MRFLQLVRTVTYSTRDGRAVELHRADLCDRHLSELRTFWGITVRRVGLSKVDSCARCRAELQDGSHV